MWHRVSPKTCEWVVLTAVVLFVNVPSSTAAPVTIDLRMHLTRMCEYTASIDPDCIQLDEYVPFSLTYDPDTFVLHDVGYAWWLDLGVLEYDVPFATLPNPWDGESTAYRYGSAYFSNNGPGYIEYREIDITIADAFYADSCAEGFGCSWRTSFRLYNSTSGTPPLAGPPTTADVEELFRRGNVEFLTEAYYDVPPIGGERTYVPGSRLYQGRVPEPAIDLLLLTAGLVAALSRRRSV